LDFTFTFGNSQGVAAARASENFMSPSLFKIFIKAADFGFYRPPKSYEHIVFSPSPLNIARHDSKEGKSRD
jgi:hypothetical protein